MLIGLGGTSDPLASRKVDPPCRCLELGVLGDLVTLPPTLRTEDVIDPVEVVLLGQMFFPNTALSRPQPDDLSGEVSIIFPLES